MFTPGDYEGGMSALLSGVRPSLLVRHGSVGGVAIGVDKLAVTRPVPEGEAVRHPGLAGSSAGNSMLTIIWYLLSDPQARYHDLGSGYYESPETPAPE